MRREGIQVKEYLDSLDALPASLTAEGWHRSNDPERTSDAVLWVWARHDLEREQEAKK